MQTKRTSEHEAWLELLQQYTLFTHRTKAMKTNKLWVEQQERIADAIIEMGQLIVTAGGADAKV